MNKCFLVGKVLNEPEFKFLYNSADISICYFYIKLLNGSILKACGYNEVADYIYRHVVIKEEIMIEGEIQEKNKFLEIKITRIEKWT